MAIDDCFDCPLLTRVEAVSNLLIAVEPMRQQAPRRRGDSRPALLAPARDFVLERRRQRQLGDVLDLPLEVLDSGRPRYGRTLRSANQPVQPSLSPAYRAVVSDGSLHAGPLALSRVASKPCGDRMLPGCSRGLVPYRRRGRAGTSAGSAWTRASARNLLGWHRVRSPHILNRTRLAYRDQRPPNRGARGGCARAYRGF